MNDETLFELLAENPIPNIIANDEYMADEIAWRFQAMLKLNFSHVCEADAVTTEHTQLEKSFEKAR